MSRKWSKARRDEDAELGRKLRELGAMGCYVAHIGSDGTVYSIHNEDRRRWAGTDALDRAHREVCGEPGWDANGSPVP